MTMIRVCLNQTTSCDPLDWERVFVCLPEGYGRILKGKVKLGDLYLHRQLFRQNRQTKKGQRPPAESMWQPADWHKPLSDLYRLVECYSCIIRPGAASQEPCERCQTEPRFKGERYCVCCGRIIVQQARRSV